MYCGKCGSKMNDTDHCCIECGWKRKDMPAPQPRSAPVSPPVRPVSSAPPGYSPPVQPMRGNDALIPPAYRAGAAKTEAPAKKGGVKALVITLVIIITVMLLVGGFLLFTYFYHNSEDYRVQRAEKAILAGNYDEGLEEISAFRSERAEAIRAYTEVLKSRERYAAAFHANELQTKSNGVRRYYDALLTGFHQFTDADRLPGGLRRQYNLISERLGAMDATLGALTEADYRDAQRCVLDFKQRKEGAAFTTASLETVTLTSEQAVQKIESKLINAQAYQDFYAQSHTQAAAAMNSLYNTASTQVHQNHFDLQNYQENHLEGETIKLTDKVALYKAKVADGLLLLESDSDIAANAETLTDALAYAWIAYAFEIKT